MKKYEFVTRCICTEGVVVEANSLKEAMQLLKNSYTWATDCTGFELEEVLEVVPLRDWDKHL